MKAKDSHSIKSWAPAAIPILAVVGIGCWFGWSRMMTSGGDASRAAMAGPGTKSAMGKEAAPDESTARGRTGRSRETQTAEIKAFAARFAALAAEMEQGGGAGLAERQMAISDELRSFDPAQLKAVVAELALVPDPDPRSREMLVAFTVENLIEKSPIQALGLLTERAAASLGGNLDQKLLSHSLAAMARNDPAAAAKWVSDNQEKFPDLITAEAKRSVLMGAADRDPGSVFELSSQLGLGSDMATGSQIAQGARTPEQRSAVLAALREHLSSLPEESRPGFLTAALAGLGAGVASDGYERASAWLDVAALSSEESGLLASHLNLEPGDKDTGKWIGWMAAKAPQEQLTAKVGKMMESWAQNDFKAAGEWINAASDGPVKESAVASYAQTLSGYEPEAAARWSLSLPAGPERDRLLEKVCAAWQKKDPVAAGQFSRDNGLDR